MMEIKERFDAARKIYGASDEIITASGVKVRGRYVLCESGVVTPSHDPLNGFRKSIGFWPIETRLLHSTKIKHLFEKSL